MDFCSTYTYEARYRKVTSTSIFQMKKLYVFDGLMELNWVEISKSSISHFVGRLDSMATEPFVRCSLYLAGDSIYRRDNFLDLNIKISYFWQ